MIALLFYLLVVPALFAYLLIKKNEKEENSEKSDKNDKREGRAAFSYRYVIGFVTSYAAFCILYIPMALCRASFRTLAVTSTTVFACICVAAIMKILYLGFSKEQSNALQQNQSGTKPRRNNHFAHLLDGAKQGRKKWLYTCQSNCENKTKREQIITNVGSLVMLFIIGFSVYRVVFLQAAYYRDDKTYIPLINDILNSNMLYGVDDFNGTFYEDVSRINIKYLLAAWYPYQAMLSWASGLHPSIIYRTVIAGVVVLCTYLILWELGKRLFPQKSYGSALFVILYFLLSEVTRKDMDQSLMATTWSSWGKNFVASVILPLLLVLLLELQKCTTRRNAGCLFLVSMAGSFSSPTGINCVPILIALVSCSLFLKEKNKNALLYALPSLMPPICGTVIYLAWQKGVFW